MIVTSVSLLLAAFGTLCMIVWPLFKSRAAMLLAQLGLTGSFGVHYALEQAATASFVNGLSALLIVASMIFGADPRLKWIGYALVPAIAIVSVITWNGVASLLSATGATLNTIGRVQTNASALRVITLAGTPFWLAHDIAISSPLLVADVLALLLGSIAVMRDRYIGPEQTPRRATAASP